jgi:hypothetical protein
MGQYFLKSSVIMILMLILTPYLLFKNKRKLAINILQNQV